MPISRREFVKSGLALLGLGVLEACGGANSFVRQRPILQSRYPAHSSRGKALIINGDQYEDRHLDNIMNAYHFLLGIGYGSNDVSVLSSPYEAFGGKDFEAMKENYLRVFGFQIPQIDGPATKRNVEASLENILSKIPPNQELFIYITGHGGSKNGTSYVQLNAPVRTNGKKPEHDLMRDNELKAIIEKGKYADAVVAFDGCEGEGFSKTFGDERTLAITKSRFGEISTCAYFANTFFHTPWESGADIDGNGNINLREAVEYSVRILKQGGVKGEIIVAGDYNPIIRIGNFQRVPMMNFVLMPNSPVQLGRVTTADRFRDIKGVRIIDNSQAVQESLSDKDKVLYFGADGCFACDILTPHLANVLKQRDSASPRVYVLNYWYSEGKKAEANEHIDSLTDFLHLDVKGFPTLVRFEDGRITYKNASLPLAPVSYGKLPDRTINIVDKELLQRVVA